MEIPKNTNVSECANAFVWKGTDGTIYIKNKMDIVIDLESHKETYNIIKNLCEGQRCALIVDMVGINHMSKAARDYSRSIEHSEYVISVALLINNPVARLIANFFTGLNKPNYFPVQLFTDFSKACKWSLAEYNLAQVQLRD